MPGSAMNCLNTIQPIIGVDCHKTIPPIPPAFAAHVVVWGEGWSQKINFMWANKANSKAASPESKVTKPVALCWGYAIGRGHDAGPHPAHIWPNLLLPLILFGSGSKSEWASGTVKHPQGNMAIAVAFVVNLNLDCWDFPFPPMPTGIVMAMFSTVKAGFTLGDFLGGLFCMLIDMAITWLVGLICVLGTSLLSGIGRGFSGAFRSVFHGGGFFGALGRGFGRGFVQNLKSAFGVKFVSSVAPGALAGAFRSATKTLVSREFLSQFPYILKSEILPATASAIASIRYIGSPVGYSSPKSLYMTKLAPENQPTFNDWVNRIGHSAAGEQPESASPYFQQPGSGPSSPSGSTPSSGTKP